MPTTISRILSSFHGCFLTPSLHSEESDEINESGDPVEKVIHAFSTLNLSESSILSRSDRRSINILVSPKKGLLEFKKFTEERAEIPTLNTQALRAALLGQKILTQEVFPEQAVEAINMQITEIAKSIDHSLSTLSTNTHTFDEKIEYSIRNCLSVAHLLTEKTCVQKQFVEFLLKLTICNIRTLFQIWHKSTGSEDIHYNRLYKEAESQILSLQEGFPDIPLPILTKYSIKDESISQPIVAIAPNLLCERGSEVQNIDCLTTILYPDHVDEVVSEYIPKIYFKRVLKQIESLPKDLKRVPFEIKEKFLLCKYVNIRDVLNTLRHLHEREILAVFSACQNAQTIEIGTGRYLELEPYVKHMVSLPTVERVVFSYSLVTDNDLLVLPENTFVRNINLSSTQIEGNGLKGPLFKHITHLSLRSCQSLLDSHVAQCSSTQLQEVDFSLSSINGSCLESPAFSKLTKLKLKSCFFLKDSSIGLCSSTKLREVDLSDNYQIEGLFLSSKAFQNIEILILKECYGLSDKNIFSCSSTKLRHVDLSKTNVDGSCLKGKAFETVTDLNLSDCEGLLDENVAQCGSKVLKGVNLSGSPINGSCLKAKAFNTVDILVLNKCNGLWDENVFSCSSTCLKEVDLSDTHIDGSCLESLVFEPVIQLWISDCSELKDENIAKCSSKRLRKIDLSRTHISGSCFTSNVFHAIEEIHAQECLKIVDDALISECPSRQLRFINLSGTKINGSCFSSDVFKTVRKVILRGCIYLLSKHREYLLNSSGISAVVL